MSGVPVGCKQARGGRERLSRGRRLGGRLGPLAAIALLASGCAKPPPTATAACLEVSASPNLNFYDGQPHVIVLYLYPLSSPAGFEQASVEDLLGGAAPPGVLGPRHEITIGPGQTSTLEQSFPLNTTQIGVVADYYRAPGDAAGTRKATVPARCGKSGLPSAVLSARDLLVK